MLTFCADDPCLRYNKHCQSVHEMDSWAKCKAIAGNKMIRLLPAL